MLGCECVRSPASPRATPRPRAEDNDPECLSFRRRRCIVYIPWRYLRVGLILGRTDLGVCGSAKRSFLAGGAVFCAQN